MSNWPVSMSAWTKGSVSPKSAAWTTVFEMSSTAPAATASAGGAPMRWRKRRFIPIRPAELGTVRLMNLIADWSTMQGRSARGVGTPPRREIPAGMKVACATTSATINHAGSALRISSAIVSNPISASWLMRRYAATIRTAVRRTSLMRTRLRGAISGGVSRPVAAAAAARSSLMTTSWCRARSRTCGVRAARWRYGRASAIISTPPPATRLGELGRHRLARSRRRAARPCRCRAPTAAPRAWLPKGRPTWARRRRRARSPR